MSSERYVARALLAVLLLTAGAPVRARVLLSVEEALHLAFPEAEVERETVFLTDEELFAATEAAGEPVARALVVRYVASREDAPIGTAYLDMHRVRTLQETVFVVVESDATIARVEVLSFDEPPDYLPRKSWYGQFAGRGLDDDLHLDDGIRAVSGATLTAIVTTAAARRVLAIHRVIEHRQSTP